MSYLQVQGINDLVRLQHEQSLEQLNIRKYDTKFVKFIACLPRQCVPHAARLDLNFFLISTNNANQVETKLKIKKLDSKLNSSTSLNEHFYQFECVCEMPILRDENNMKVIYYYYLKDETSNNLIQVENLLNERRMYRLIDMQKSDQSKAFTRMPSVESETDNLKEQIDGLVLFNQEFSYSKSDLVYKWNFITLNCLSRIDYLFSRTLNKESHTSFQYRLKNLYECLIASNSDMKIVFDKFLVEKFSKEVTALSKIEYLDEWQYVGLITMFYLLCKFNVQFRDYLEFSKLIFKLHKPRLVSYFKALNEYFTQENKK